MIYYTLLTFYSPPTRYKQIIVTTHFFNHAKLAKNGQLTKEYNKGLARNHILSVETAD